VIEAEQVSRIYEREAVWGDITRPNILFDFVQQRKHIGVLTAEARSGESSAYEPDMKPWLLWQQTYSFRQPSRHR